VLFRFAASREYDFREPLLGGDVDGLHNAYAVSRGRVGLDDPRGTQNRDSSHQTKPLVDRLPGHLDSAGNAECHERPALRAPRELLFDHGGEVAPWYGRDGNGPDVETETRLGHAGDAFSSAHLDAGAVPQLDVGNDLRAVGAIRVVACVLDHTANRVR